MHDIGQTIRQARKAKGWSLKTFSEKIGISIMTLQRIETGQVSPSVRLMVEIAYQLGRPITDFIRDKERTLVRIKSNRIKSWATGSGKCLGIYPPGVIEPQLGLYLMDLPGGGATEWESDDIYKGYNLLEGSVVLEFEDKKLEIKAGETVYFDARFQHRLTSPGGAQLIAVYRR